MATMKHLCNLHPQRMTAKMDGGARPPWARMATVLLLLLGCASPAFAANPVITEGSNISKSVDEDSSINFTLNATDADPGDEAVLAWSIDTAAGKGLATATGTGTVGNVSYTPNPDANGSDSFKVQVSDGGNVDKITVNVTINPLPDDPVITEGASTSVTMDEDGSPTSFSLTLHATDADGDTLTWSISSIASHGTASASGTGTSKAIGYTPTADYNGSDAFDVQVSDGTGRTDTITVNVTIDPQPDDPVITEGASTSVTMDEDGSPTAFSLTLNATDADGNTLTWSISSVASHGTASASGTGPSKVIGYTPTADYNGSDAFGVQVSDGTGGTDTITVNVTIDPQPDDPVITEGASTSVTMDEDGSPTAFSLTLNATDPDGNTLTWSISSVASHGTASASGTGASKAIGYTPTADYNGSDAFDVQVSDGTGRTDTITVNVTIDPQPDDPVITEGASTSVTMDEDGSPTAFSLTLNATDADGNTLTWSISTVASHGTASASGTGPSKVIGYTPTANYNGSDTFGVQVSDGTGGTDTITVNVTIDPVNDAPTITGTGTKAITDKQTTTPFDGVTIGDVDTPTPTLDVTVSLDTAAKGALSTTDFTDNGGGVYSYSGTPAAATTAIRALVFTPVENRVASGTDEITTFTVEADDGTVASPTSDSNSKVTVTSANDDPVANDDVLSSTNEDTSVVVEATSQNAGLLANDTDVDPNTTLSVSLVTSPSTYGATVTVNSDGDYVYNPTGVAEFQAMAAGQSRVDSFTYNVSDGHGGSDTDAAVTITVTGINDAPVAVDDTAVLDEDEQEVFINVLANDSDVDSPLTIASGAFVSIASSPSRGSVSVNPADNTIKYVPRPDENGSDSFQYSINDNGSPARSATATVNVTINPVNDEPVAENDTAFTQVNTPVTLDVLANDTDLESALNPLTVQVVSAPGNGTADVDPVTGEITYTPDTDFNGIDGFTYTVQDQGLPLPALTSNEATVTVSTTRGEFIVDTLDDENDGNLLPGHLCLREALQYVAENGTIDFDPSLFSGSMASITLALGELRIEKNLTLYGPGANLLTVDADGASRALFIGEDVTVSMEGITFTGGMVEDEDGAGLHIGAGSTVTLLGVCVRGNEAVDTNSALDERGGGIYSAADLRLENSTVAENWAGDSGGGVYNDGGTVTLVNSTLSGNEADLADGGGLFSGGANPAVVLANCTVYDNSAVTGGGVARDSGSVAFQNSLIAGNAASGSGRDVNGEITSSGHNMIGNPENSVGWVESDVLEAEAEDVLDSRLLDNGGGAPTHALRANSPAIDAGDSTAVVAPLFSGPPFNDQRGSGFDRIAGASVDVGAYEVRRFTVDTLADENDGPDAGAGTSLRDALALAVRGDNIDFAVSGEISIDPGLGKLRVTTGLAINGPGDGGIVLNGGDAAQILYIESTDDFVVVSGIDFTHGYEVSGLVESLGGGALYNWGELLVEDCLFTGNSSDGLDGGAILNRGDLTLRRCVLSSNTASNLGGALVNWGGTLRVEDSEFTNNAAGDQGGAISNLLGGHVELAYCLVSGNEAASGGGLRNPSGATMELLGVTMEGNSASIHGGGLRNGGTLTLTNCTVSGNEAGQHGGGVCQKSGAVALVNCTITQNKADEDNSGFANGGGVAVLDGTASLRNTIVAENTDTPDNAGPGNIHPDLSGVFTSLGHNLVGVRNGATGLTNGVNGDLVGSATAPLDPRLGPLADYGGPYPTHTPRVQSPAIDAGTDDGLNGIEYDQRGAGFDRMVDGNGDGDIAPDMGAVEFRSAAPRV